MSGGGFAVSVRGAADGAASSSSSSTEKYCNTSTADRSVDRAAVGASDVGAEASGAAASGAGAAAFDAGAAVFGRVACVFGEVSGPSRLVAGGCCASGGDARWRRMSCFFRPLLLLAGSAEWAGWTEQESRPATSARSGADSRDSACRTTTTPNTELHIRHRKWQPCSRAVTCKGLPHFGQGVTATISCWVLSNAGWSATATTARTELHPRQRTVRPCKSADRYKGRSQSGQSVGAVGVGARKSRAGISTSAENDLATS